MEIQNQEERMTENRRPQITIVGAGGLLTHSGNLLGMAAIYFLIGALWLKFE